MHVNVRKPTVDEETVAAGKLRAQWDPTLPADTSKGGKKLSVKAVYKVFEPDRRGLVEILYVDINNRPMTAWTRDQLHDYELVSWEEGW